MGKTVNIFIDKFNDDNCRAGGLHQWFGDEIYYLEEGGTINARKYNLLSDTMKKDYNIIGGECTCNKCGIKYTAAHNPHFI